ncbi:MAG: NADH:flavin oxidoreductase/NADH oxidase [Desulfovibrionaceae bacterium]|nr:NADH:flavin oxidoreductase/NADH oxidase [Desulfovibrionaceae bacterium]
MSALFSPFSLGGLALQNRIVVAPMCQYSAKDGQAAHWHTIHLGHLALSGAGLLITEATAVTPEGRISPQDLGLYSDDCQAALARVLRAVRAYSPIPLCIQLAHAGRKASTSAPWSGGRTLAPAEGGWRPLAPSALPFTPGDPAPLELDRAGLARIREAFAQAARRAGELGFDCLELHNAHGYLLHEFLSPLSNRRTDEYGGTLANRMRFPLEVFAAVREATPAAHPVGVRISATDWLEGGWDIEDSIVYARELKKLGCAYIHASGGGTSLEQKIPLAPGYQVPLAERIRRETGAPTIAVGLITRPAQAEEIVASGQADLVALARAMLYDPRWPWHAAAELGERIDAPQQYLRAAPHEHKHLFRNAAP